MAIPGGKVSEDGGKGVMVQRKEEVTRIKVKECRGNTVTTQKIPCSARRLRDVQV